MLHRPSIRGKALAVAVALLALWVSVPFSFSGPGVGWAQGDAAVGVDSDPSVPVIKADEFLSWLEGKDLAYLELWDPQ